MSTRNPKLVFWTTYWVTFTVLSLTFGVGLVIVDRWLFDGKGNLGGGAGTMGVPFLVLSAIVANLVCRRLGISKEERTVEIIQRGKAEPNPGAPTSAEMRYSAEIWRGLAYVLAPISLLILLLVFFVPVKAGTEIYGFILAGAFGLSAVFCWLAYSRKFGFIGRADESGVSGYKSGGVSVQTVVWNKIESCEVTTVRDALGRLSQTLFIFKSKRNFVLLRMPVTTTPPEQVEQFKAVVDHHLSAPKE